MTAEKIDIQSALIAAATEIASTLLQAEVERAIQTLRERVATMTRAGQPATATVNAPTQPPVKKPQPQAQPVKKPQPQAQAKTAPAKVVVKVKAKPAPKKGKRRYRRHSPEIRAAVTEEALRTSVYRAAKKYDLSHALVEKWCAEATKPVKTSTVEETK